MRSQSYLWFESAILYVKWPPVDYKSPRSSILLFSTANKLNICITVYYDVSSWPKETACTDFQPPVHFGETFHIFGVHVPRQPAKIFQSGHFHAHPHQMLGYKTIVPERSVHLSPCSCVSSRVPSTASGVPPRWSCWLPTRTPSNQDCMSPRAFPMQSVDRSL